MARGEFLTETRAGILGYIYNLMVATQQARYSIGPGSIVSKKTIKSELSKYIDCYYMDTFPEDVIRPQNWFVGSNSRDI